MRHLPLAAIGLILVGCAPPRPATWDKTFESVMQKFIKEAANQGFDLKNRMDDLQVSFGDTEKYGENVVGECSIKAEGKFVEIDQEYWGEIDDYEKEELLFHELGHCVLRRAHREDKDGYRPLSIMYPEVIGSYYMQTYHSDYMKELFSTGIDSL